MATPNTTAPSAAPAAAAPASPAAPGTPAPVAAAAAPTTLNDFAELARQHIAGELSATPAPVPVAAGQEPSPAAPEPDPANPASTEATPSPDPQSEDPTAEDVANWTEGEKKLHGALVKERAERKEARAELRQALDKLAEIEKQIKSASVPPVEPAAPAAQPPAAPVADGMLADCQTFEAVDARMQQAATTEAQAVRLQNMLNRNGVEPVAEKLKASGVETINGKPITEASADEIGEFLATVYEGAKVAQAQAPIRKNWLVQNQQSLQTAVQIMPELNDAQSPAYQAAVRIVQQNPLLRQRADWPVVVAKLWLGEQAFEARAKPAAPAAPAAKAPAKSAAKPAPGAPRTSIAALPQTTGRDTLKAKIAAGTATLAEVQEYTRDFVAA